MQYRNIHAECHDKIFRSIITVVTDVSTLLLDVGATLPTGNGPAPQPAFYASTY